MTARSIARPSKATKSSRLSSKLAALAGATGAVAAGTAEAVPYTPTAGVAAAQNIPGFSFNTATNTSTLGALRPPAGIDTTTTWDVDGNSQANFVLGNFFINSSTQVARFGQFSGDNLQATNTGEGFRLLNLAVGASVGPLAPQDSVTLVITNEGALGSVQGFTLGQSGQFGFSFAGAGGNLYGWGSMVIDGTPGGQGFKITEAYYQTTPGSAILVGQVPQAVPEPSSMALLAIGAAGVTAWRARRKQAE